MDIEVKYFEPVKCDMFIPSLGENEELKYNTVSADLFNSAVLQGYMTSEYAP